jgi:hypothetical protein
MAADRHAGIEAVRIWKMIWISLQGPDLLFGSGGDVDP